MTFAGGIRTIDEIVLFSDSFIFDFSINKEIILNPGLKTVCYPLERKALSVCGLITPNLFSKLKEQDLLLELKENFTYLRTLDTPFKINSNYLFSDFEELYNYSIDEHEINIFEINDFVISGRNISESKDYVSRIYSRNMDFGIKEARRCLQLASKESFVDNNLQFVKFTNTDVVKIHYDLWEAMKIDN